MEPSIEETKNDMIFNIPKDKKYIFKIAGKEVMTIDSSNVKIESS